MLIFCIIKIYFANWEKFSNLRHFATYRDILQQEHGDILQNKDILQHGDILQHVDILCYELVSCKHVLLLFSMLTLIIKMTLNNALPFLRL